MTANKAHHLNGGSSPDVLYWRSLTAGLEEIINVMRTYSIAPGWQMDEEAASDALAYCRRGSEGGRVSSRGERVIMEFVCKHGQSLDWVFRGNPVSMVCDLAGRSEQAALSRRRARRAA